MKNIIQFSAIAFALCMTLPTNAQQNAITVEGLSILRNNLTLSYERSVTPVLSLRGEFQKRNHTYTDGSVIDYLFSKPSSIHMEGFRMNLACRYYPAQVLEDFYLENGFFWGMYDITIQSSTNKESLFAQYDILTIHNNTKVVGVRSGIGMQFHMNVLTIDLGAGLNFAKSKKELDHIMGLKPVTPYVRAALGFNF